MIKPHKKRKKAISHGKINNKNANYYGTNIMSKSKNHFTALRAQSCAAGISLAKIMKRLAVSIWVPRNPKAI